MLVLAPAACCLAGVAVHDALTALFHGVHGRKEVPVAKKDEAVRPKKAPKGAAKVAYLDAPHACLTLPSAWLRGNRLLKDLRRQGAA